MPGPIKFATKGFNILSRRLKNQGLRVTLIWMYGRGLPKLTGIPVMWLSRITPEIYVGGQYGKNGKRRLEQVGIEYEVNLRIEFDDAEHGLALKHYCHLPTIDDDAISMEHLHEGVAFIRDAIAQGGKVYIHCAGGVGRAPTMAAAYFISQGMTLDHAIKLISQTRPFIQIMPPQMQQLKRFEAIQREEQRA